MGMIKVAMLRAVNGNKCCGYFNLFLTFNYRDLARFTAIYREEEWQVAADGGEAGGVTGEDSEGGGGNVENAKKLKH